MKTTAFLFIAFFSGLLLCSNAVQAQIILNPELGKKYLLATDINITFSEEANEHREATENKGKVSFGLYLTPEKLNATGNYDVKCQLQNFEYAFDKRKAETHSEFAEERKKNFESALQVFKENTFRFELSKKGELVSIKGLDEIYAKIMESRDTSDETIAEIRARMPERLEFVNTVFKMLFNQLTGFYTDAAVKPGDVYTKTGFMNLMLISAQHTANYTIKEANQNSIYFTGEGNITMKKDSAMVVVGKLTSDIQTNIATGLIDKATYWYEIGSPEKQENKEKLNIAITLAIKEAE